MSTGVDSTDDLATHALELVHRELNATLDAARREVEEYVDGQAEEGALQRAASLLHLASGALKIVEVHGAALLADEMEQMCLFMAEGLEAEVRDKAVEALTRAIVQLPAYLERLLSGGRDVALVLLPLVNELRSVRGKPMMSEGTLLLLRTGPLEQSRRLATGGQPVEVSESFRRVARQQRPRFQAALLGWIRGEQVESNLDELISISSVLEQAAGTRPVQQFWGVLCGLFVALRAGGLEGSVALKRLVGQADRQLKRLSEEGESVFASAPPSDLLNNFLYYVARADCDDERVLSVRSEFDLDHLVPGDEQLQQAREHLSGPSVRLMQTVAEAIKQDLGSVKDSLDIFVRTGMEDYRQLLPQLDMLRKIGDTLGVLGLERAQAQIREQMTDLSSVTEGTAEVDQELLERIAAVLLNVEDALDKELVRAVVADEGEAEEEASEVQYEQVTQAVMGECIVNMARIKEAVVRLVDEPDDTRALEQIQPQLRGIAAGLLMLNKTPAVRLVERVGALIAKGIPGREGRNASQNIERLADAIVSIEYYMETVSAGRKDPWYMLDNADRCLDLLERQIAETEAAEVAAEPEEETAAELVEPAKDREALEEAPLEAEIPGAGFAVLESEGARPDPELLEVFIEEAKEEIRKIRTNLPLWIERPDELDPLIATRRSFHTLKGSGRTIGAVLIGEFAWSVENLMNRLINRTLAVSQPIVALIEDAVEALPALIDQLELGIEPKLDIAALCSRADALAGGQTLAPETAVSEEAAAEAVPSAGIDPVLAEIFVKEMRGHLETLRAYVEGAALRSAPYEVDELAYRASHTLLGSANMANYSPCIVVAEPLAEYLAACYQSGIELGEQGLGALARSVKALTSIADALASNESLEPPAELVRELRELASGAKERASKPLPEAVEEEESAGEAAMAADEPAIESPAVSFDPELAAIFSEEASEILDQAEAVIGELRGASNPAPALGELQRLLHTLKGGARMAGVVEMGNLSHSLENILSGMAADRLSTDEDAVALIQRAVDSLQNMRDCVDTGRPIGDQRALEDDLDRFAAGAPASAETVAGEAAETGLEESFAKSEIEAGRPLDFDLTDLTDVAEVSREMAEDLGGVFPAIEDEGLGAGGEVPPPAVTGTMEIPDAELAELEDLVAGLGEESAEEDRQARIGVEAATEEPAARTELAGEEAGQAPAEAAPPEPARAVERLDMARVDAQLLDALLNSAGEISIFQARLNQQLHSIDFHLSELAQTVTRLREQLRNLESETEAEILYRHEDDTSEREDFDPLELDRYSTIQQLSRGLAETANDVASINELLQGLTTEADTLLTQQGRVTAEIQDGLMQTRMVPFQRHIARFARVVRQAAADTSKSAELSVEGAAIELDRQVLEAMLPPFEHLLRNCVAHGIELPAERRKREKPETGLVSLKLRREGGEVSIELADDGAGLNVEAIRRTAVEQGLIPDGQKVDAKQAAELILQPGFTTAGELTQAAGRGVGMDVVDNELKKLGGSMHIETQPGHGTKFLIRLPYTLAITHALIVDVGEETFALPLTTVEGITRVRRDHLLDLLTQDDPRLEYGDLSYRLQHLGSLVGAAPSALPDDESAVALVLIRAGERSTALLSDNLEGSREVVVKGLGPHIASVPGVTGATILGDGRVVMILDVGTLIRQQSEFVAAATPVVDKETRTVTALVVDDSITMRRVTERLLERRGVKAVTARDGLDAIQVMQESEPDIILLDIEMPRMDGYQFAAHVRNDPKFKDLPIIMITSRSGEKHRARAIELGVNDYLSKPYQESQLIAAMESQLGRKL